VKINKKGKVLWNKTVGGSDDEHLNSIVEIAQNKFLLGGNSYSGISGDKTESSRGSADYWIVTLNDKTGVSAMNSSGQRAGPAITAVKEFTVYPNPASDMFYIQTNNRANISLTDRSGKIIVTKSIEGKGSIDVSRVPAGVYYLKNTATGETQKVDVVK